AHVGLHPRRLRLHHLGPPHLKPVPGDEGVERHILRFKGRHAETVLLQHPAQSSRQNALARIGHGALYHDRSCHCTSSCLFSCFSFASLSSAPAASCFLAGSPPSSRQICRTASSRQSFSSFLR